MRHNFFVHPLALTSAFAFVGACSNDSPNPSVPRENGGTAGVGTGGMGGNGGSSAAGTSPSGGAAGGANTAGSSSQGCTVADCANGCCRISGKAYVVDDVHACLLGATESGLAACFGTPGNKICTSSASPFCYKRTVGSETTWVDAVQTLSDAQLAESGWVSCGFMPPELYAIAKLPKCSP